MIKDLPKMTITIFRFNGTREVYNNVLAVHRDHHRFLLERYDTITQKVERLKFHRNIHFIITY